LASKVQHQCLEALSEFLPQSMTLVVLYWVGLLFPFDQTARLGFAVTSLVGINAKEAGGCVTVNV
jgi:hypothetical protein